jgi:ABC-type nitrate/sulfonate/bicarbonate transport system permease component
MSSRLLTLRPRGAPPGPQLLRVQSERLRPAVLAVLGLALALGLWQFFSFVGLFDPSAIPSMSTTFRSVWDSIQTAHLWSAVGHTLEAMAIGFALGSALGITAGTVIGLNRFAYASCFLVVEFFRVIPIIAVLPLFVLLFGTTLKMKVILIVFGGFFPTVIQTVYGVRSVDPVVRDTATIFGLGRIRRFFVVTLPSAAPFLATGLRLGATGALLIAVVAEVTAGGSGIGVQILQAQAGGDVPYTFALLVITGLIGMLLVLVVTTVERRVLAWHEVYRAGRP